MKKILWNDTYCGREEDKINVTRKHYYNFFPNNTSISIIDVMHFIKYNLQHPPSTWQNIMNKKLRIISHAQCHKKLCPLTHSMSRIISAPLYNIDLNISVVMMRQDASGLKLISPVRRPTSNFSEKSLYFWLLIVLIGAVYTALVQCCTQNLISEETWHMKDTETAAQQI